MSRFYTRIAKNLDGVNDTWLDNTELIHRVIKHRKLAAKKLRQCGYTPYIADLLGGVLSHLAMDEPRRQAEVLRTITTIVMGKP